MKHPSPGCIWRLALRDPKTGKTRHILSADYPGEPLGDGDVYERLPNRTILDDFTVNDAVRIERYADDVLLVHLGNKTHMVTMGRGGKSTVRPHR